MRDCGVVVLQGWGAAKLRGCWVAKGERRGGAPGGAGREAPAALQRLLGAEEGEEQPERQRRKQVPHRVALRHKQAPQGAMRCHTAPRGATRRHKVPQGATKVSQGARRWHTAPQRCHKAPECATRRHKAPRGATQCRALRQRGEAEAAAEAEAAMGGVSAAAEAERSGHSGSEPEFRRSLGSEPGI